MRKGIRTADAGAVKAQHFRDTQGALCRAIEQSGTLSDEQQAFIAACAKEYAQQTLAQ